MNPIDNTNNMHFTMRSNYINEFDTVQVIAFQPLSFSSLLDHIQEIAAVMLMDFEKCYNQHAYSKF